MADADAYKVCALTCVTGEKCEASDHVLEWWFFAIPKSLFPGPIL